MTKSTKKTAPKKVVKTPAKKVAAKKVTTKPASTSGNKELDKMLAKIAVAKKNKETSVVIFTTNRGHHKAKLETTRGFSHNDLKPKILEAYKYLLCKFDLHVKFIDPSPEKLVMEWIVNIK